MGIFSRAPKALLPPDVAHHIAVHGKFDFDSASNPMPGYDTIKVMTLLQTLGRDPAQAAAALAELSSAALAAGGWAVYGAYSAVGAFLPSEADSPTASALHDARLRFLRSENLPRLRDRLTFDDRRRYDELFPGEL